MEMPADSWIEQLFVEGLISLRENPRLGRSPVAANAVAASAAAAARSRP
jgi:hypothetical protein